MQVYILKRVLAGTGLVGKVHVVEVDVAVGNFIDGILRVVQIGLFTQHFADTAYACEGHAYHNYDHAEHHEAHQQAHYVAEKAREVAGGEVAGNYKLSA